jgi:hypothetical protein
METGNKVVWPFCLELLNEILAPFDLLLQFSELFPLVDGLERLFQCVGLRVERL